MFPNDRFVTITNRAPLMFWIPAWPMRREYQEGVLTNEKRDYYLVHVLSLIDGAEDDAHHDGGDDLNPGDHQVLDHGQGLSPGQGSELLAPGGFVHLSPGH